MSLWEFQKQTITINMKRIKGNHNSKERFKIISWNPLGEYKRKPSKSKEEAKLNALRKVIEKGRQNYYNFYSFPP